MLQVLLMWNSIFNNDLISAPGFTCLIISDSHDESFCLSTPKLLSYLPSCPPGLFFACLKGTPDSTVSNSTNDLHPQTTLLGVLPSFSPAALSLPQSHLGSYKLCLTDIASICWLLPPPLAAPNLSCLYFALNINMSPAGFTIAIWSWS